MTILELDQSHETPLTEYQRGSYKLRYAYARSKDCQESGERGQDYLVWRVEPSRLAFALCDGVGQSFFGGLGSQIVGEALLRWLWDFTDNSINNDLNAWGANLREYLDAQKDVATALIEAKNLETVEADMIRDALETRREKRGTQSNFVCGLIDLPSKSLPRGRVLLFWLGDAKIQLWQGKVNKTAVLKASWNKQEGWSSKFGTFGEVHSFHASLDNIDCIIAHSDGVDPIQQKLAPDLPTEKLRRGLSVLGDDDVSFLEIRVLQAPKDLEDDLANTLRTESESPVKIVKQTEYIKLQPEKEIIEVPRTPRRTRILFVLWVILASIVFYIAGFYNIPRFLSPRATNTPQILASSTPRPTRTLVPTETPSPIPTIMTTEVVGILSNSIDQTQILLTPGCSNIVDVSALDVTNSFFLVHGPYMLTGYSDLDCQGEVIFKINEDATQGLTTNVLSVQVEIVSTPVQPFPQVP